MNGTKVFFQLWYKADATNTIKYIRKNVGVVIQTLMISGKCKLDTLQLGTIVGYHDPNAKNPKTTTTLKFYKTVECEWDCMQICQASYKTLGKIHVVELA
jgi:hypothetical protein